MIHFTIYSRSWCHLCEDMRDALQAQFGGQVPFTVEMVDVDEDASLVALYDELVPVLTGQYPGQVPVRLCHYHLDPVSVGQFLAGG